MKRKSNSHDSKVVDDRSQPTLRDDGKSCYRRGPDRSDKSEFTEAERRVDEMIEGLKRVLNGRSHRGL